MLEWGKGVSNCRKTILEDKRTVYYIMSLSELSKYERVEKILELSDITYSVNSLNKVTRIGTSMVSTCNPKSHTGVT